MQNTTPSSTTLTIRLWREIFSILEWSTSVESFCSVCKKSDKKLVSVNRGVSALIKYIKLRKDEQLEQFLEESIRLNIQVYVHEVCWRWCNSKRTFTVECNGTVKKKKEARQLTESFDWRINCFLCGYACIEDKKNPTTNKWHRACTLEIRTKMLNICSERLSVNPENPWALYIHSRIYQCINFVATEARYHQGCQVKFRLKRGLESDTIVSGRKQNKTMMDVFLQTGDWLEHRVCVLSFRDFMEKMREYAGKDDQEVYDKGYIKKLFHRR